MTGPESYRRSGAPLLEVFHGQSQDAQGGCAAGKKLLLAVFIRLSA